MTQTTAPGTLAIVIIAAHLVADFPLQTDWMAENKGSSPSALFAHVTVHAVITLPVLYVLIPSMTLQIGMLIVVTHTLIDMNDRSFEPKDGFESYPIWCDQAFHVAMIAIAVLVYQSTLYT